MFDPVTYILAKKAGGGGGGGSSGGYKGTVATVSALPNNATRGDSYYVTEKGCTYVYDGGWKELPEPITNAQIDALFS